MDVRRIFVAIGLVAVCFPHTVLGAGQAGWSSGTTQQPTNGFDRYNNQASGAPSITQRAQTAISDTGTSLRDGMEAGIRAGGTNARRWQFAIDVFKRWCGIALAFD